MVPEARGYWAERLRDGLYFKSGAGGSGIHVVPSLDLAMYKMAASDAQPNPELTDIPLGYEPDTSRDNREATASRSTS
jgi:hypothetical protein